MFTEAEIGGVDVRRLSAVSGAGLVTRTLARIRTGLGVVIQSSDGEVKAPTWGNPLLLYFGAD